jgi:hypothetical protein
MKAWVLALGCLVGLAAGCGARSPQPTAAATSELVGLTSRAAIEDALPVWRAAIARAAPDGAAAAELASVPPGAEVDVYLGTWCGDSVREVARLFRALEHAPAPRPFTIRFIAVDHDLRAEGFTEGADLRYVPTLVVRRDGEEVGRVVESAPRGIERELVDLLRGTTRGVITGRADL